MKALLAVFLLFASLAVSAAPMTNYDVIKLVKGGLGEATVLQAIDAAEPGFDTSPDGLVQLKGAGVSDAVIQHVLARRSAAPTGTAPPASAICRECGTVTGVREVDKAGKATGLGAVAGGVVGGVLGHNLGGGKHRTAGTLLGAVGGGLAGNQIEKSVKTDKSWEIGVQFDDGSSRVFTQATQPGWAQGARVRLVNGALAPL